MPTLLRIFLLVAVALVAVVAMRAEFMLEPAVAAFPGGNGKIAFTCPIAVGDNDICTMNPDGSGVTNITNRPGLDHSPRWSADGTKLVFTSDRNGVYGIYMMEADGVNVQLVTAADLSSASWSPDGTKVVLSKRSGGNKGIFVVNVDGSGLAKLTPENVDAIHPSWSPDGAQIAYAEEDLGIFVMNVDGSNRRALNAPSFAQGPDWSPDGTRIAYRGGLGTSDSFGIYVFDINAGTDQQLNVSDGLPAWSPDGTKIAFDTFTAGQHQISVMDADGSNPMAISSVPGSDLHWGPAVGPIDGVEFTQAIQELQTIQALQTDLEDDGQPPVAIVAGKQAAMRVYFGEVQNTQHFTVEVSGQLTDSQDSTIDPGCTPSDQRRHETGCLSTDFYFTPPEGFWSVTLVVKDFAGEVVLEENFDFQSVKTGGLKVAYLQICVKLTVGADPTCPSNFVRTEARNLMRKLFPVADDEFSYDRLPVPNWVYDAPITTHQQAVDLLAALRKRYELMSEGGFVADQLAGWVPAGGATGLSGISDPIWAGSTGRVSWQKDTSANDLLDAQHTLAHEIAHNLGLRHTHLPDGCGASDAGTDWPYTDSTIQEVGYDVAARQVMPETQKDLMTYCTPPGSNIWISPHTYRNLIDGSFDPQGTDAVPAGGAAGQFLVLSGTAQADGSTGTLDPAYVVSSTVPSDPPDALGNHCLRLTGASTMDYCFTLGFESHRSQEPLGSEAFTLRVPLPVATTSVALISGATELARLDASPNPPSLDVTTPAGSWSAGSQTLQWSASDADGDDLLYTVLYSPDGGDSWLPIEVDTPASQFSFDVATLEASEEGMFRVLASDGLNTSVDTTPPVQVGQIAPKGDVDCSGGRTSVDALVVLQLASNLVDSAPCEEAGDVNCDADLNSLDALFILQDISGFDVALPPGCDPFD